MKLETISIKLDRRICLGFDKDCGDLINTHMCNFLKPAGVVCMDHQKNRRNAKVSLTDLRIYHGGGERV